MTGTSNYIKVKRKILITGGAGFIGSCLAERLAQEETNQLVLVDNLLTGSQKNLPQTIHKNTKFIKANVNNYKDISSIFHTYAFDYVFHYAAMVGVKRTIENPARVLNDLVGIRNILDLSKNTGVKRVFYSSSSEVYGEPVEYPQNEYTTPLNSRLPYAIVKNVGEASLRAYYKEYGLNFTIFRFFNTYGPKQSTDFVISKFLDAAVKNQDITIYGDGMQTRTFCYIEDHLDATVNAFYHNLIANDVANIGSEKEITIIDLARLIIKLTKSKSKIVFLDPLAEGDMTRRKPDIEKMRKLLNHESTQLEDGIRAIIKSNHLVTA